MIEAGKLDRVVTFERSAKTVHPSGTTSKSWIPFLTVRAEVRELRTEELTAGFGQTDQQNLVFIVRWNPIEITTEDRVIYAGRGYDIKQIVDLGRRVGWKISGVAA